MEIVNMKKVVYDLVLLFPFTPYDYYYTSQIKEKQWYIGRIN